MQLLKQHIEALIFCSEESISLDEIRASLKISMGWEVKEDELIQAIDEIRQKYFSDDFAFELCEIAGGYEFLTKKEYHGTLTALLQHKAKKKLSVAQMETLAIIAYKQPISKTEIEHIRGVNCDYAVQKLLEKEMIMMLGKSDGPGKPMLYATSQVFMDYFGINSVTDLPQLKDLRAPQNEIGSTSEFTRELPVTEDVPELTEGNTVDSTDPVLIETIEQEQISPEEEIILTDENPDATEIPDRKKIFLENENSAEETLDQSGEISMSAGEEDLPS